jgi:hypothetical protein
MVIFTVTGILTWHGFISLLPILAVNLTTFAFSRNKLSLIRKCMLPSSTGWLIYNIATFSIAGTITEVFNIVSLIIAFFRFDKRKDG